MNFKDAFGELRSLLQQPASLTQWRAVLRQLKLIEDYPEAQRQEALYYAASYLQSWPAHQRVIQDSDVHLLNAHNVGLARGFLWQYGDGELGDHLQAHPGPLTMLLFNDVGMSRFIELFEDASKLREVKQLHLNQMGIDDLDELKRLLSTLSQIEALDELALDHVPLDPELLRLILDCPALKRLKRLSLQSASLGAQELALLGSHPNMARLEWLSIGQNSLGERGAEVLASGANFKGLSWLSVWHGGLGDGGLKAICAPDALPKLKHLNLGGNSLNTQALDVLMSSTFGPNLETLWLWSASSPRLNDLKKLLSKKQGGNLRRLNLNNVRLSQRHAEILGDSPGSSSLEHLQLYNCQLDAEKLGAMLSSGRLSALREIDLRNNSSLELASLKDELLKLPALEYLDLRDLQTPLKVFGQLIKDERFAPKLRHIELDAMHDDLGKLKRALSRCPARPSSLFDTRGETHEEQPFDDFAPLQPDQGNFSRLGF